MQTVSIAVHFMQSISFKQENNPLDEFVVNPHTECEETFSLSLCGERLGKASHRFQQVSMVNHRCDDINYIHT